MSVLFDGTHLVSDSSDQELHAFARKVGLRRDWFQNRNPARPHYDIISRRLGERAIRLGARLVETKEIVLALRRRVLAAAEKPS